MAGAAPVRPAVEIQMAGTKGDRRFNLMFFLKSAMCGSASRTRPASRTQDAAICVGSGFKAAGNLCGFSTPSIPGVALLLIGRDKIGDAVSTSGSSQLRIAFTTNIWNN